MPLLAILKVLGQVVYPAAQAFVFIKDHFEKKKKEAEEAKKRKEENELEKKEGSNK